MHLALAADDSDPAFAPEPFTQDDSGRSARKPRRWRSAPSRRWTRGCSRRATRAADGIDLAHGQPGGRRAGTAPVRLADALVERIESAPRFEFVCSKIRVHGDYHLGQVLWAEGDFYLLDFEGEPARALRAPPPEAVCR